ncbi:MAG TPA: TonB family protein [Terriglobales bacterium]|nr:TonB family protein [Terriglobales bacterium]
MPIPPRPDSGELYDAHRWESAYREMHDVPSLLIQLQDDLDRSRKREAFWMSVVVHLVLVILIVNSQKFERFFPHRTLVVGPNDWMRQKELTYLELPPDAQKLTKKPNTNIISDKDRIATSRTRLDPNELRKILDSARPGAPGHSAPAAPPASSPPAAATAQAAPAPQPQQPQPKPQPPAEQNQVARLQTPAESTPKPSFNVGPMTAGSAIAQAARAAIANRGASYGGDDGDYGFGQQPAEQIGPMDVLSDTMGVDFGPYLARVLHDVRQNWYNLIPEVARAPLMKKGKVSIQFAILKDGRVAGMQLTGSSGDVALDRAAWGGITGSNPFPPLPTQFAGQYLALRFHFYYNPDKSDLQ